MGEARSADQRQLSGSNRKNVVCDHTSRTRAQRSAIDGPIGPLTTSKASDRSISSTAVRSVDGAGILAQPARCGSTRSILAITAYAAIVDAAYSRPSPATILPA